ncbi:MAG: hypothetical protein PVI35_02315 [Acidimicrobiia bacterium]
MLDPEFVADVEQVPLDELRARRKLCDELDTELSYYRRLLHGRMDLLAFEMRRRAGDEDRSIIEALPEILTGSDADSAQRDAVPKALPIDPPETPHTGRRSVDRVLGDDFLTHLPGIANNELEDIQAALTEMEREVSRQRRGVYEAHELIHAELIRRYRDGLATVDELLQPG